MQPFPIVCLPASRSLSKWSTFCVKIEPKSLQNQDLKQVKFGIAFSLHFLPEFSILDPILDLILEPKIASKASKLALPAYGGSRNVHDASKSKLRCPKSASNGPSTSLQNASQRAPTHRLNYIVQTL